MEKIPKLTQIGTEHRTPEAVRLLHIVLDGRKSAVATVGKHYRTKAHEEPSGIKGRQSREWGSNQ